MVVAHAEIGCNEDYHDLDIIGGIWLTKRWSVALYCLATVSIE